MKLISDLINRRLETQKDLDLNYDTLKSIWHFYQVYQICLNVLGISDPQMKKKNILIKKLLLDRDNFVLINKLKEYMSIDSHIIESTFATLEESDSIEEIVEDFYPISVIGVSIYDRE